MWLFLIISELLPIRLRDKDYHFLAECLKSQTSNPEGISFYSIYNGLKGVKESVLQVSLIKLERMGLVSKSVETDEQGYDYYAYAITELGVDELLKNEDKLEPKVIYNEPPMDFDDDIPF